MPAATLMIQGAASSVGKSVVAAALCRIAARRGLSVAPFKAQNMALNAAVTAEGGEIGRAQHVQALAAGVAPHVDMNPILLKPEGDARSQVIVFGRAIGSMSAVAYHAHKPALRAVVADALARLRACHDLVVIEGAGSPAEINLRDRDLVNMFVAGVAAAPVLLVGDIDRGGVFAALHGTMSLLAADERARIAGFVINKFRGDRALLEPGLAQLRDLTGVPVRAVIPHLRDLAIADEDSLALDDRPRTAAAGALDVAVVRLPRISNFDELVALERAPGVHVRFVDGPAGLVDADLAILPGTKCTIDDLHWLRARGLADAVIERARRGRPVLGICGGYQMLGDVVEDPDGVESARRRALGLGLLPVRTRFGGDKITRRVRATARVASLLAPAGAVIEGYEIHAGRVVRAPDTPPAFVDDAGRDEGCVDGAVVGTSIHGLLEDPATVAHLVGALRARRGLAAAPVDVADPERELDRLADAAEAAFDRPWLDAALAPARHGV